MVVHASRASLHVYCSVCRYKTPAFDFETVVSAHPCVFSGRHDGGHVWVPVTVFVFFIRCSDDDFTYIQLSQPTDVGGLLETASQLNS